METRQTSIDCYNQIRAEGLLSKRRLEVYEYLFNHGPMTMGELFSKIPQSKNVSQASITPRFAELRDFGVIYEKCVRECKVTGRTVIEWDLTNKLPQKKIKKQQVLSKKEKKLLSDLAFYIIKDRTSSDKYVDRFLRNSDINAL